MQSACSSSRTDSSFASSPDCPCCGAVHLVADAEQVLHVVADLVGEHVGLREVAGGAEAARELAEEVEVDVDLAVGRAVEGPHRRRGATASGLHRAAEQVHLRQLIAAAGLGELCRPHVLNVDGEEPNELDQLHVGVGCALRPPWPSGAASTAPGNWSMTSRMSIPEPPPPPPPPPRNSESSRMSRPPMPPPAASIGPARRPRWSSTCPSPSTLRHLTAVIVRRRGAGSVPGSAHPPSTTRDGGSRIEQAFPDRGQSRTRDRLGEPDDAEAQHHLAPAVEHGRRHRPHRVTPVGLGPAQQRVLLAPDLTQQPLGQGIAVSAHDGVGQLGHDLSEPVGGRALQLTE